MKKKNQSFWLILTSALLGLSCQNACQNKDKGNEQNEVLGKEEVVNKAAIVNGHAIDKVQLDKLHNLALERMKRANRPLPEEMGVKMRSNILMKLIDDEIIRQEAEKEGVKVDRIERVAALEDYKNKIGGQKAFDAFKENSGMSEDELMETLNREKLKEKLAIKLGIVKVPTDKEIEEHYNNNKRMYQTPEMVHARHILFKLDPNEPKEKEEAILKKVNNVLKELKEHPTSFAEMASKYSDCPSAKNGGDLGSFPRGQMVKPFEDVAFSAPLKTIQGPVKTDFGYHLIYVEEKNPLKEAELGQVKDRIIEFLTRSRQARGLEEALISLRKKAKINIFDKSLSIEQYLGRNEQPKKG